MSAGIGARAAQRFELEFVAYCLFRARVATERGQYYAGARYLVDAIRYAETSRRYDD